MVCSFLCNSVWINFKCLPRFCWRVCHFMNFKSILSLSKIFLKIESQILFCDLSLDITTFFSWHEIGVYDLPANIDYILNATGQNKLFFIGHSQGTTSFFVMASERPEYNDKIAMMTALAPAAYLGNIKCPLCLAAMQILPYLEVCKLYHYNYFSNWCLL